MDARDHVFKEKALPFFNRVERTLCKRAFSTKENFQDDRLIFLFYFFRDTTIKGFFEALVLGPFVGLPQGVTEGRPPEVFPSPPP